MKRVNFQRLVIRNFLSIGEVILDFKTGLNGITGVNLDTSEERKNGVGKSSLLDAVQVALFGEPIRKIKNENLKSWNNKKGSIELSFTVDGIAVNVVRQIAPSKAQLTVDGIDKTHSTLAETNRFIENLIGINSETFRNTVITSINDSRPFMAQDAKDKRRFIEGILNLCDFADYQKKMRDEYNLKDKGYTALYTEMESVKKNIATYEKEGLNFEANRQKSLDETRAKLSEKLAKKETMEKTEPQKKITATLAEMSRLDGEIKKGQKVIDGLRAKIREIEHETVRINSETKALQKELQTNDRIISGEIVQCNHCLQVVGAECIASFSARNDEIKNIIATNAGEILSNSEKIKNEFQPKIVKVEIHIKGIQKQINDQHEIHGDQQIVNFGISSLESEISDLERYYNRILTTQSSFETLLTEAKVRLNEIDIKIARTDKELKALDILKHIFSEEGAKTYITKKVLGLLNNKIQTYIDRLGFPISLTFNAVFEEEIKNYKGEIVSYYNFSGAERKTIDMAILFSFIDMRRTVGDVATNVLFFDEILDSTMDKIGMEALLNILKERVDLYGEAIYVISHRKESFESFNGEVILLEKQDGITRKI